MLGSNAQPFTRATPLPAPTRLHLCRAEMFRKLLLTSVSTVLAASDKPYSQLLIKLAISFLFLMFFVRHSPFAASEVDVISVATQTCTLLTLMYALCIKIDFFQQEGISDQTMKVGLIVIQMIPFAISLIILGWLAWALVGDVIEERALQMQRDARKHSHTALDLGNRISKRAGECGKALAHDVAAASSHVGHGRERADRDHRQSGVMVEPPPESPQALTRV